MIVETAQLGARAGDVRTEIPDIEGEFRLRDLLCILIEHEVAAYSAHRAASEMLRVLTPSDIAIGFDTGSFTRETRTIPAAPTVARAHARAEEAFGDGLFFAFVDDVRIEDLDQIVALGPLSRIRLVRLVALTGR